MSKVSVFVLILAVLFKAKPSLAQMTTAPTEGSGEMPTVAGVDLNRYQGRWYELASIPASFQRRCVAETMAEYKLLDDGLVQVVNSCEQADGTRQTAEARARINPKFGEPSKLQVTFVKLFGSWVWAASGDYWIIDLDPDYDYVVVGHPQREYGWILSRTKALPTQTLLAIREKLVSLGYDPCVFRMSRNSEQVFPAETRLCDLK